MSEKQPRKVIYIGSIPYDQTEEQVLDIAKSIGPVIKMKMMFDKETGKSKGFAFIEYKDIETASSAVRNLNNYSIGNRSLKCDFSTENSLSTASGSSQVNNTSYNNKKKELPPLPPGQSTSLPPTEAVSQALRTLDQSRLDTLVHDSIKMAKGNPVLMEELLAQCPQLGYALVEALLSNQKVSYEQMQSILVNSESNSNLKGESNVKVDELDDENKALIKQVLEVTDEQLQGLPEEQRLGILEIKKNYENGVYGIL